MKNFLKKYQEHIYTGFTLIELMIVVAIIAIISALTLFNNAKLNSAVLLSDTAYEISLIIRDAQISGLGSKVYSVDTGSTIVATTSNQGIYVDLSKSEQIVFFSDKNRNDIYDATEENQTYNIENKRAGKILQICTLDSGQNPVCSPKTELSIIFKRPNPEAYFYFLDGNRWVQHYGSAVINIGFDDGECRSIIVYKTGAIQIDKSYCN